jgi:hypothetical protein
MTSDEIKNATNLDSQYFWLWLKEIAYQLAVSNERNAKKDQQEELDIFAQDTERRLMKNMSVASPVGTDSSTEVRGEICREGWHRFNEFRATKPYELPPDYWRCLNCGWTRAEIQAVQPSANTRTTRSDPQTAAVQPQKVEKPGEESDWRCPNCQHVNFPVRRSCGSCGQANHAPRSAD